MTFLPIAILAYAFNAGSIIINKILLQKSLPNPISIVFYISVLGLLTLLLIPFGFTLPNPQAIIYSTLSGIVFTIALYAMFVSLKYQEASVVGPVVGALNPLFTVIIGGLFFAQVLTTNQILAIIVLVIGSLVLTVIPAKAGIYINNGSRIKSAPIKSGSGMTKNIVWMVTSGLFFALSYVFLREAFLQTSFLNGLIISRLAAGIFALTFLFFPNLRKAIFAKKEESESQTKIAMFLLLSGQILGAAQGLLLTYAVSIANPALVNSLFGVQYVVILTAAIFLYKKHPHLLEEKITKNVILQKVAGVIVLSGGLYLLTK